MSEEKKEQFTKQEEIKVELTAPVPEPNIILSTNRKIPIRRFDATPLKESHGMTTEAGRFRES